MLSQFAGAVFDRRRKFRFLLWRFWNDEKPRVLFIGLNPSTADEYNDDPTIRRCLSFAQSWDYGGLYICNVFAYRSTDPKNLNKPGVIHDANLPAIIMTRNLVELVVCAWGDGISNAPGGNMMASRIAETVNPARCFGMTKSWNPKHPLYLSGETKLEEYLI